MQKRSHCLLIVVLLFSYAGVYFYASTAHASQDKPPVALDTLSYARLMIEQWQSVVIVETILKNEPKKQDEPTGTSSKPEQGDKKFIKPYLLTLRFDKRAMGMRHAFSGTGFVCGREGIITLICTNAHVVAGGNEIIVKTASGKEYSAVELTERKKDGPDFTVLAFESEEPLSPVIVGDSDKVAIAEAVMAIGHPHDFHYSPSHGIVSGRRTMRESENLPSFQFFQLDMAINLGNSGSPLFNMRGEVIGIVEAIWKDSQGIAFAIPANDFQKIIEQAREQAKNQQTPATQSH